MPTIEESIITYTLRNSPYECAAVFWNNPKHSVKWMKTNRSITWDLSPDLKQIDPEAVLDVIAVILENMNRSAPLRCFKPSTVLCIRRKLGWNLPMYDTEGRPIEAEVTE